MRKCPKCKKTYDDSWKICLQCSVDLSDDPSAKESVPEPRKQVGRERSAGVTVFGIVIMIGSIFGLLNFREGWKVNPPVSNYLYILMLPVSFIAAAFLLALKNWARVAIIVISVITLAETAVTAPSIISKAGGYEVAGFKKMFYASLEEAKKRRPGAPELTVQQVEVAEQKALLVVHKIIQTLFLMLILFSAAFNCLVIYFFSLPRVRKQFS